MLTLKEKSKVMNMPHIYYFVRCNLEKTEKLKHFILNMIPGLRVNHILQKEYIRDLYSYNNERIFILECHIHRYHVAGIYRWQFFDFTMVCWITHLHDTLPD